MSVSASSMNMPPRKNFERLIEERTATTLTLACGHTMPAPDPPIPGLDYAVCRTCMAEYADKVITLEFERDPFPRLRPDNPFIGRQCAICAVPFTVGDVTMPVPMAFVQQQKLEDHDLYIRYRGRTTPAALVHADCAVHKIAEQMQPVALVPTMHGPLQPGDPDIWEECPLCHKTFIAGDLTMRIPGRGYLLHQHCFEANSPR